MCSVQIRQMRNEEMGFSADYLFEFEAKIVRFFAIYVYFSTRLRKSSKLLQFFFTLALRVQFVSFLNVYTLFVSIMGNKLQSGRRNFLTVEDYPRINPNGRHTLLNLYKKKKTGRTTHEGEGERRRKITAKSCSRM